MPTHSSFDYAVLRIVPRVERQEFVNCLTTNLTAFFREEHHFPVLAQALTARRPAGPPRIWCNAASTGEEPYSIAMTVAETLGSNAGAEIVASDIDTKVLATAARGVYGADARGLGEARLRRHFLRGKGANQGSIRVRPELGKMIEFRPTAELFERPQSTRTRDYVTGRFG